MKITVFVDVILTFSAWRRKQHVCLKCWSPIYQSAGHHNPKDCNPKCLTHTGLCTVYSLLKKVPKSTSVWSSSFPFHLGSRNMFLGCNFSDSLFQSTTMTCNSTTTECTPLSKSKKCTTQNQELTNWEQENNTDHTLSGKNTICIFVSEIYFSTISSSTIYSDFYQLNHPFPF